MSIAQRRLLALFILIVIAVPLGAYMLRLPPFMGDVGAFAPGLARPDALIRTYSLAKLPPDLLKMPLAHDVLNEDFVTYYEQHEDRLALSGTVRRIAYEHRQDLPGRLIESALDEPAEVALWLGADGRLRHFAVVMTRNALARAIQTVLPVVSRAADVQLSSAGKLDGTDVDILALEYGHGRQLLLLAKGDRVVALSNPGMLFAADGERNEGDPRKQLKPAVKLMRELLESRAASPFARHFLREEALPEKRHELTLGARAFAFGYEAFMPELKALALAFDDKGAWQSEALFNGPLPDSQALWAALPHGPGLCAALPVDWTRMALLLNRFNTRLARPVVPAWFIDHFTGAAAVCWYKDSRFYTPLFAARLKADADEKLVKEFFALAGASLRAGTSETFVDAENGVALWRGKVASRFGAPGDDGARSLEPALAILRDTVFFSPNAALVERARDVVAKRYPALADSFGDGGADTLAFADPGALAALLRKETFAALPRDEEALFRNAADAYLAPRLEALARYPAQRIVLTEEPAPPRHNRVWRTLKWETGGAAR
ncbi:MAG: DUF2138 domain-containing protein [Azoarcus sp.]|jgi:uncharacterized protein YfaA (DUF2138 family)|nr:DUF2138 domain-containing protein [Azoarcus sp.]